jgi:hypothetical protein
MDCQHCRKKISIIRGLTDTQYCCEDHRWLHLKEMNRLGLELLMSHGETSEETSELREFNETSSAGSDDSTESACFRIGARVIQPPLIV